MRKFAVLGLALLTGCMDLAFAAPETASSESSVQYGVGRPRVYLQTVTSGDDLFTDGTDPVLIPWGGTVQIDCPALVDADRVLVCFSMHIDGAPDVTDGQLSDGTLDGQCHGMMLTASVRADDMAADIRRFSLGNRRFPGAQFTGACDRPGTAYDRAPCLAASSATDCGTAAVCTLPSSSIAGAWMIGDASVATIDCIYRVDI